MRGVGGPWRKIARRLALAAGGAAALAGGPAARAQQAQDTPRVVSELRVAGDHVGVNLVSGRTEIELPVLSVPAAPNLRFDRVQNAAPYILGRVSGQAGEPPTGNWSIHTPGTTEAFGCVDWMDCDSATGTGSYFRGPAGSNGAGGTYRQAQTGAVWHFTYGSALGPGPVRQSYASNVSYPGGETIVYSYDTTNNGGQTIYRPKRIESNLGYFITIAYPTTDLYSLWWGSPSEVTLYSAAAPTTPLGRLSYSYNGGNIAITDLAGRIYNCAGCTNSLGTDTSVWNGSSQPAGDPAPSRQVAQLPSIPMVGSVTQDGVQFGYTYTRNGGAPYFHAPSNSYWYTRLAVTGPNGFNQVYNFVQSGQRNVLTSAVDSLGRTTSYTFDFAYRPTQVIYPEGNRVNVAYDDSGNVTSRTATPKAGSGLSPIVETANYVLTDCAPPAIPHINCYRPTWSRDGLNRQTDYLYNSAGQITEQTEPADASGVRRRTITEYAASPGGISRAAVVRVCGVGTTCGTNQEIRTEFEYLGDTRLVTRARQVDPATGAALETNYSYDLAGRVLATDGPLPGAADTSYNRYDAVGQLTGTISADPDGAGALPRIAARNSYDQAGRLIKVETGTLAAYQAETVEPPNWTGFTINRTAETQSLQNRKIREFVREGPAGTVRMLTEYSYDTSGRLACTAVRMNPAVFAFTGAPDACTPNANGGDGPDRIARNVYDTAGQRVQLREGVASADEAAEATWAYNLNGKITTVIDGNGNRAELRYDGHMRQDRWTFPSTTRPAAYNDATQATALASAGAVNAADYEAYTYDAAGNRLTYRKRDGSTFTYAYDNLNRTILKVVPERAGLAATHTRDVYYGYDLRNAPLYARFDSAAGEGVSYGYDGFGRQTSSYLAMDGVSRGLGRVHDDVNNRVTLYHPSGYFFTYANDVLGRLSSVSGGFGASVTLAQFTYNNQGLPETRAESPGSGVVYGYDAVGRLASLADTFVGGAGNATIGLGYNPAGQISSRSQSNDAYAWNGAVTVNRAYTTNGLNQYTAAGPAAFAYDANGNLTSDGSSSFTYDVENRLVAASGARTAALRYDPLGRLYEVTGAAGTTQFLYDGDALVAEYLATGLAHVYVHGSNGGADDPLVWYTAGTMRWLHADNQGSITGLADPQGALASINTYDEYGIPGAANYSRFQYTGQVWLTELGMYHYKARIYSPTLGRFLQTDPVGYDDQVNLYAYVGNDPVNATDPDGRYSCGNLSGPQCRTFIAAQNRAIRQMRQSIGALRGLRSRLAAGRLNAADRRLQAQMNRYLGRGAGSSDQVIAATIGVANRMMGMLEGNVPANLHRQYGRAYLNTPPGGAQRELQLFPKFFSTTDNQRTQGLAHDAHHGGTGSRDTQIFSQNIGPYGERNVVARARFANNPLWVLTNPDAATFALGFTRDDD